MMDKPLDSKKIAEEEAIEHKEIRKNASEKDQAEEDRKNRNFHQIQSQHGLNAISEVARQGGSVAVQVLILLCMHADYINTVQIRQVDIVKTLGVSRTSVHNALNFLIDFGLLEKKRISGTTFQFILNPDFVWRTSFSMKKYCPYNGKFLSTKFGKHGERGKLARIHTVALKRLIKNKT